jgi:Lon protease-like protein
MSSTDSPDELDVPASIRGSIACLPVFPLPETQLFPRTELPLHIFEPRYRTMLADALRGPRLIAIVELASPSDDAELPPIRRVGGLGLITDVHALPDGRAAIMIEGRGRVRLHELEFAPPYRTARAELLIDTDTNVSPNERMALGSVAASFVSALRKRKPDFEFQLPSGLSPSAECDRMVHQLIADSAVRQEALETLDVRARIALTTSALAGQLAIVSGASRKGNSN